MTEGAFTNRHMAMLFAYRAVLEEGCGDEGWVHPSDFSDVAGGSSAGAWKLCEELAKRGLLERRFKGGYGQYKAGSPDFVRALVDVIRFGLSHVSGAIQDHVYAALWDWTSGETIRLVELKEEEWR